MASVGSSPRIPHCAGSYRRARYSPLSIHKVITAVFAVVGICSAFVIDSRSPSSLDQSIKEPISRTSSSATHIPSHQPNRDVQSSITLSFTLSGTATPLATSDSSSSSSVSSSNTAAAASKTSSSSAASFTGLPQPFDTPLGNNFTSTTCPSLFQRIISDPAVKNCVPISLLLQGSHSFFTVETSEGGLSRTLDISCNAISATCNNLLESYALAVSSSNGCKSELESQNQRVQYLFNGLISYLPIYNAACLQVSSTSVSSDNNITEYCFEAAVQNDDNASDLLLYTLPLGLPLPAGSAPSCSSCTQKTMAIFAEAARNLTSPLSDDYIPAAALVNAACGSNFVSTTFSPIPGSDAVSAAGSLGGRRLAGLALTSLLTTGLFTLL